jgi:uncharacterized protein (TIGR02145 family)
MINIFRTTVFLGLDTVLLLALTTCIKVEKKLMVATGQVSNLSANTAKASGTVVDIGEGATQYGHCYGTSRDVNPGGSTLKTELGKPNNTGDYTSQLTNLAAGTTYYIKAYVRDANGYVLGKEISFTTSNLEQISDIDGNVYNIVNIGAQVWMKENLKTTKYKDGTDIPLVTNNSEWSALASPAYCWYNNAESTYKADYGALYNWHTVSTGKLCPTGWHAPTDAEWTTLATYLGGTSVAGGKLKETGTIHWLSPNSGATNESGFTALPGGECNFSGTFVHIGDYGSWWSSTEKSTASAVSLGINYTYSNVGINTPDKSNGYSVRCLKD